jgi:hypothetical protein
MPIYDGSTVSGYLERLRMGPLMQSRIEEFVNEYQAANGLLPEFIFVENPINALGGIDYSNLILLSGTMYMEFSLNQPNRTITFLNIDMSINRIVMSGLQQSSFSAPSTENSRLTVQIFRNMEAVGFFEASGDNCSDLLDMLKRYFIPSING